MAFASGSNYRWERWISLAEAISGTGWIKHTCTHSSAGMGLFAERLDGSDSHMNKDFRIQIFGSHTAALKDFGG